MAMNKGEVCDWVQCYVDTEMMGSPYKIVCDHLPDALYERLAETIESCFAAGGDSMDLFLNYFQNDEELENWICEVDNIFNFGEESSFDEFHGNLKDKLGKRAG